MSALAVEREAPAVDPTSGPAGARETRSADRPPNGPAITVWRRGLVDGRTASDETEIVHTVAHASLRVRAGRLERGSGYATAPAAVRHELARLGAILRLRSRGRYHLHAAGVVDPAGRGWLLVGSSGSGKSTLAYAAARSGWRVLGDDGVVIEHASGAIIAHGWREALHVSIELARWFPELEHHAAGVDWNDARHRAPIPIPFVRCAPVHGLVFVTRGERDVARPLAQTEALAALIGQSPMVLFEDPYAPEHLATLRALAASVPAVCLEHTPRQLGAITRTLREVWA